MWMIAGILLGVVVLAGVAGVHSGPHAHGIAVVAGVVVAGWFVFMAADGRSTPLLWALLGADLVLSAGLGLMAWKALTSVPTAGRHFNSLESAEGVALTDLSPEGIVQIRGEQWSASSVNGTVRSGTRVQVIRDGGVRLDVWGEDAEAMPTMGSFGLDPTGISQEGS